MKLIYLELIPTNQPTNTEQEAGQQYTALVTVAFFDTPHKSKRWGRGGGGGARFDSLSVGSFRQGEFLGTGVVEASGEGGGARFDSH